MPKLGVVVAIDRARAPRALPPKDAILGHLDGLYRFALRLTRNRGLAEELTQESALRALQQKKGAVRNLRAWLFRTLYHAFVSHYRRGCREEYDPPQAEAELILSNPLPTFVALEDVRKAIESLPYELRSVVWLSDAEEFHLREIAEILGLPEGTVASRLWRARQELRRLLAAYGPPSERRT